MKNKLVIITGTSKGIGKAIALEFLFNNFDVIGLDRLDSSISHHNYIHHKLDIYKDELPNLPKCNILINNAGTQNENDIDNNLKATIKVTEKYAFQDNIESVLFIASSSATSGAEFYEYAASKGGVISYMKNCAMRLNKYQATSNSLSPGGVITELNDHILKDKKLYDEVLNETLLKRWASVEEIAKWAYFVTVINKSMTAQDILIDNGEANNFNFVW
jgi:3-oxoacyl-[acyl-carrier protein] reductase